MAGEAIGKARPAAEHSATSSVMRRLARRAALAALCAGLPGTAAATPYELTYTAQNGDSGDLFFTTGSPASNAAQSAEGYVNVTSLSGTWDGAAASLLPPGGYGGNDNLFRPGGTYSDIGPNKPALTFAGLSFAAGGIDVNIGPFGNSTSQSRSDVNPTANTKGAFSTMTSINISRIVDTRALVNVQFGVQPTGFGYTTAQYQGPAVLNGGANRWNLITGALVGPNQAGSNIALTDASGAATGVKLSYSTPAGFYNTQGSGLFANDPLHNLLTSYIFSGLGNSGPARVMLSGLKPGETYELLLYSVADTKDRQTAFTVDGETQITTAGSQQPEGASVLVEGDDYAEFLLPADGSGDLAVSLDGVGADPFREGDLNGLQLLALPDDVPEPASGLLLAGGLTGLFWCRRSRS